MNQTEIESIQVARGPVQISVGWRGTAGVLRTLKRHHFFQRCAPHCTAWRGTAGVLLAMCLLSLVSGQRKTIQNTSGRTLTTGGAFCQLASTAHECVEGKNALAAAAAPRKRPVIFARFQACLHPFLQQWGSSVQAHWCTVVRFINYSSKR